MTVTSVAHNGIQRLMSPGFSLASARNNANKKNASSAPQMALQIASPLTAGCETCSDGRREVETFDNPMNTG
jgi:hypothetical protein